MSAIFEVVRSPTHVTGSQVYYGMGQAGRALIKEDPLRHVLYFKLGQSLFTERPTTKSFRGNR